MSLTIVQAGMGGSGNPSLSFPSGTGTVAVQGLSTNIVSGTAQASTSGTAITFTGIPSYAKRITINIAGMQTSSTAPPNIQIGSGSFANTGYLGSNIGSYSGGTGSVLWTTGFGIGVNTSYWASKCIGHGSFVLTLLTGNTWVCNGGLGRSDTATNYSTFGSKALSGTLDRVQVTMDGSATFTAGTINILYE